VLKYHSAYALCLNHSLSGTAPSAPLGSAQAGTEYGPQWMKIPSLAAGNQSGVGRRRSSQIRSLSAGVIARRLSSVTFSDQMPVTRPTSAVCSVDNACGQRAPAGFLGSDPGFDTGDVDRGGGMG
jgi:hypothetical protein